MIKALKKNKIAILSALSAAFAATGIAAVIYFIIFPSGAQFHSDCTDTIYWANASYESGKVFSPDFNYAALLPFGSALLMLPFVAVFGVSMTAQTAGMITFALLFFAGVFFFCRSAGFELRLSLTAIGIMAFVLSMSEKLREIFWCHIIYYSLSALFIFVLLGLVFNAVSSISRKGYVLYSAFAAVFSLCVASNSLQIIVTSTMPVILAIIAERILDGEHKLDMKHCFKPFALVGIIVFASLVGVCISAVLQNGVSAGYENAYSNYSAPDKWLDNLMIIPSHWFTLLGVEIREGDPLFSVHSITQFLKLGFSTLLAIIPIVALFFYKRFDRKGKTLLLTHWALTAVIVFAVVFGSLSTANWRLSPIIATGVLVCLSFFRTCFISVDMRVLKRLSAISLAVFILCSAMSGYAISALPKNGKAENDSYKLGMYLKDNGLKYGYATFWNSQATTLLTDSAVKVRSITVNDEGISPYYYQSSASWFNGESGVDRYFIVLTQSEVADLAANALYTDVVEDADLISIFEIYTIIIYNDNPFSHSNNIPEKNQ